MSKVTLSDIANLQNETSAVATINENSTAIDEGFNNTLSRDGTSPNEMEATLDMNSNRIINLPAPVSDEEPLRLADLEETDGITSFPFSLLTGKPTTLAGYGITDPIRIKQTAATDYYVRTDATGDTGRTGLANTVGDAFLTIQGCLTYLARNVDFGNFNCRVNVAAGTYTPASASSDSLIITCNFPWVGVDFVQIYGAGATTILRATANNQTLCLVGDQVAVGIANLTFDTGGFTGIRGMTTDECATIDLSHPSVGTVFFTGDFNTCVNATWLSQVNIVGPISIDNDPACFAFADTASRIDITGPITLLNTPNFTSGFVRARDNGHILANTAITFVGSADAASIPYGVQNGGIITHTGTTWPGSGTSFDDSVYGPSVAVVDNSIVRWNGTTGNSIQGASLVTISDAGALAAASSIKSSSTSAGIGYATGAGSSVTQATNKTTAVTINTVCGQIVTNNAALAAGAEATFTVNNTSIANTDVIIANHTTGGTNGAYLVQCTNINGGVSFSMTITNLSAGSLSEAITINYAIIKAVAA